jgi:hypothetical protein
MKTFRLFTIISMAMLGIITACKDDSLVLIPEWESGVHGLAEITSSNTDFLYNDPNVGLDLDLQWVSIDGMATVTRIEVFVVFNESYIDIEGNEKIASHGGEDGRSLLVLEGGEVPANRTPVSFSLTQADLYALYQDATFNYGNGEVSVFSNPAKPQRNATQRFMWDDAIKVRWEFTTDDGRVFDRWGVSVCTEFPGANCAVDFGVVCASAIAEPEGDWVIDMVDTYGDGWQGGYIIVKIDGADAQHVFIPDQYENPPAGSGGVPISSLQTTVTVPPTATSLSFEWSDDDYNSECEFTITSPKGNVVADVSNPSAGPIKLNLCLE